MKGLQKLGFFLFLGVFMVSCGPSGGSASNNASTNNATNNASNNGVDDVLGLVVDISPPDGQRIMATALNADGSELAIALQDTTTFDQSVVVYATADGAELRRMKDFAKPDGVLADSVSVTDLYWSNSGKITALQTYRNRYTWDAASGDVLQKKTDLGPTDECAGPQDYNIFHPAVNQAFVRKVGEKTDEICRINFDTGEAELIKLAPSFGVVESIALDSSGERLWVNYSRPTTEDPLSTEIVGTVSYDSDSIGPDIQRFWPEGGVRAVLGDNTVTGLNGKLLLAECAVVTFEPCGAGDGVELDVNDRNVLISANGAVLSAESRSPEGVMLVALPEATKIGALPIDDAGNRSFSADGRFGAFDIDDVVKVYDVSGRTSATAFAPIPEPPSGTLSGSVIVDGDTASITGICEVEVDAAVGAVGFVASGTTPNGWGVSVASQNLLLNQNYAVDKDDKRYVLSTLIAQNLEVPFPTAASDGTTIQGAGTLYVFTGDFLERAEDATDPTGFDAIEFEIDAVCTP